MFETYRMLGRERELELESEAARLRPLAGRPLVPAWVVVSAVSIVLVAVAASVARAEVWPGGRAGSQFATKATPNVLAPDDRLRPRIVGASYPDFVDRFVARHRSSLAQVTPPGSATLSDDGFNWTAAGLGASSIAGLLLVLGVGLGVARRSRAGSAGA
jgi:hypothetical protein